MMARPKRRRSALIASVPLLLVGTALIIETIVEGVWYAFWAASASHAALARSWGGPSAVGATLVHWCVGLGFLLVGSLLFWGGWRLRRRPRT